MKESMDLFELFDMKVEGEKTTKTVKATQVAKKEKKKDTQNNKSLSPLGDDQAIEGINVDTIIRFASMDLPLGEYFHEEEILNGITIMKDEKEEKRKINKEDLRIKLEREYPELIKELTNVFYVKEKNMLLVINSAGKKGAEPKTALQNAVFWNDGKLYLTDDHKPVKIPYELLDKFIAIARGFAAGYHSEVHADIYFDRNIQEFKMIVPKQTADTYWVETENKTIDIETALLISSMQKIAEIHSHHTMDARPSSQDDSTERAPLYYVIVGNVNSFMPSVFARTFDVEKQRHVRLSPFDVFSINVENPNAYPQVSVIKGGI